MYQHRSTWASKFVIPFSVSREGKGDSNLGFRWCNENRIFFWKSKPTADFYPKWLWLYVQVYKY